MYLHSEIDLSPLGTASIRGKNAHVHMRTNVNTSATGGGAFNVASDFFSILLLPLHLGVVGDL